MISIDRAALEANGLQSVGDVLFGITTRDGGALRNAPAPPAMSVVSDGYGFSGGSFGEALDSVIFYPVALMSWLPLAKSAGITNDWALHLFDGWSTQTTLRVIAFNWVFKVAVEVLMTPVTYAVCNWLKRAEREDFYDRDTDFNPFSLKD